MYKVSNMTRLDCFYYYPTNVNTNYTNVKQARVDYTDDTVNEATSNAMTSIHCILRGYDGVMLTFRRNHETIFTYNLDPITSFIHIEYNHIHQVEQTRDHITFKANIMFVHVRADSS